MIRRVLTTAATAALLLLGFVALAPQASAQDGDLNCGDFNSQAEAQSNLDANPSDPNKLDGEGDGIACETFDYGDSAVGTTSPATTPTTTGSTDGTTDGDTNGSATTGTTTGSGQRPVGGVNTGFGGTASAPGSFPWAPVSLAGAAGLAVIGLSVTQLRRRASA